MYNAILEDFWIMTALTIFLSLTFIFAFHPASSLLSSRGREKRPHVWLEDAQYLETFGDILKELDSERSRNLIKRYHEQQSEVTHFCFLVHGYSGLSQDLAYLETVMNLLVNHQKHVLAKSNTNTAQVRHDMVVHVPRCNEYKTKDGVERGGDRLVEEMLETIRKEMRIRLGDRKLNDGEGIRNITISMLGNSLGGVYSRYAIAKMLDRADGNMVIDGLYRVHFNVFCTTATPHLGISKHTYFPIPRTAEIVVAYIMGSTGKDLFRVNDLLKTMATSQKYLKALGRFRKRIAYANAYRTDFPVPTATAAFLHSSSTYPHHFGEGDDLVDDDFVIVNDNSLIVSTCHTQPVSSDEERDSEQHVDDLAHMSHCLDSLGWKKVFVDLRHEIPVGINVPKSLQSSVPSQPDEMRVQSMKRQRMGSRDVAEATTMPPTMNRIPWPLGHNMIVAFSRSSESATFNKGGRPVVNALAIELVDFIFSWEPPSGNVGDDGSR